MFKLLHSKGIGTETKVTLALSQTEEDKLWETGVINLDSLTGLLRAVFFTIVRISTLEVALSIVILRFHNYREKVL